MSGFSKLHGRVARAFFLASSLLGARAHADEEPVRVQYEAAQSCPDEAVFVARVRSRTEHGRFASPGELARTFSVSLRQAEDGFAGRISFLEASGQQAQRSVSGASCDEVASSLALIMALSIDDRVAQSAEPSAPAPGPRSAAPSAPQKKVEPTSAPSNPAAPREAFASPAHFTFDFGLNGGAESWVMPRLAPVLGVFVAVSAQGTGFSARLSAFDARQTVNAPAFGQARFATELLRAEVCPVAVSFARGLALTPCAGFDGGVLRASASGAALTQADSGHGHGWFSALALARLAWLPGARLVLTVDGELGVPLVHDKYQFLSASGDSRSLFSVPALGAGAKLGLAVRFP